MRFWIASSLLFMSFAASAASSLSTPFISGNALFLGRSSNFHSGDADPAAVDPERNGFDIQEAELQFYADVDPYSRLSLLISVHPEFESTGTEIEEKWVAEPEEAFAETNSLPSTTLKLGKFKAAFGKHNQLHTHAFPLVEAPLGNTFLLGEEGLNDAGVSAAVLLPSSWFSEITGQFLRGEGENAEFNSPAAGDGVGVVHWKNLVDVTDDFTCELGFSGAQGGNSLHGTTSLAGADLTFKWRPADGGRAKSWLWATEYISRTQSAGAGGTDEKASGLATWMQYQFAERWAAIVRYDDLTAESSLDPVALPNDTWTRGSVGLAYSPSEFSTFKVEVDSKKGPPNADGDTTEQTVFLQGNFTIGAHPAHSY